MKCRCCAAVAAVAMPSLQMAAALRSATALSKTRCRCFRVAAASVSDIEKGSQRKIAIVGGGLAGLATTYHLLQLDAASLDITIWDKAPVGTGGASAVAGGLLHPLSPRGKLVHWGLEGLEASNQLIKAACGAASDENIVLSREILRLAQTSTHVQDLQRTAKLIGNCTWLSATEVRQKLSCDEMNFLGGLSLTGGCQVIHVPSYLEGLWRACREQSGTVSWKNLVVDDDSLTFSDYDDVILAAGAGLFESLLSRADLPIQLVHGQSVELETSNSVKQQAVLCGKYVSPLPQDNRVLIGATHEYAESKLLEPQAIYNDLRARTEDLAPFLWQSQHKVHRVTMGTRVQSERSQWGRRPIIGCLDDNKWLFAGLSSRGLLYHALYGKLLARAVLAGSEDVILEHDPSLLWWKTRQQERAIRDDQKPVSNRSIYK